MQHERNNTYVNYFDLAVQIDPKTRLSRFIYEGRGIIADNISVRFENSDGKTIADLCSFGSVKYVWDQPLHETYSMIRMELTDAPEGFAEQTNFTFRVKRDRIEAESEFLPEGITAVISGNVHFGNVEDCFAMCIDRDISADDLRAAYGPATSTIDD